MVWFLWMYGFRRVVTEICCKCHVNSIYTNILPQKLVVCSILISPTMCLNFHIYFKLYPLQSKTQTW